MKNWHIEYWTTKKGKSPVEQWFDELSKEQFKSIAKEIRMLEIAGNSLKLPHSRSLGNKLFELRERRFGYRVYYTFGMNKIIILLAAGDKKSQEHDIKVSRARLLEIKA
jgi:putative addiction module killer protein